MRQTSIAAAATLLACTTLLLADGGTLQFRKPAGPFIVTVFSEPVPVRVGNADLSVMLERASDQSSVLDAKVDLHLKKTDAGSVLEIAAPATHARATNKLLYATSLTVSSPGTWQLTVEIRDKGQETSVSGPIEVSSAEPPVEEHWPLFAIVPLMLLFLVLNLWLRSRRRARERLRS